jgi:hypothetical protein
VALDTVPADRVSGSPDTTAAKQFQVGLTTFDVPGRLRYVDVMAWLVRALEAADDLYRTGSSS